MDWIYAQAILYIRDLSTLRGENFQQIDGQKLSEMKEEEFLARDAVNGPTLYRCLQDYRTQCEFLPAIDIWVLRTACRTFGICRDFVDFCFSRGD